MLLIPSTEDARPPSAHPFSTSSARLSPILSIQCKCPSRLVQEAPPTALRGSCHTRVYLLQHFELLFHLQCSARWLLVLHFQHAVECVLQTKQLDYFTYVGSSRILSTQPGTWQRFNESNKKVGLATKLCQGKTKVPWAPSGQTLAVPGRFPSQCLIVSLVRLKLAPEGALGTQSPVQSVCIVSLKVTCRASSGSLSFLIIWISGKQEFSLWLFRIKPFGTLFQSQ